MNDSILTEIKGVDTAAIEHWRQYLGKRLNDWKTYWSNSESPESRHETTYLRGL